MQILGPTIYTKDSPLTQTLPYHTLTDPGPSPYSLSTYTTNTTASHTQTHVLHSPCSHMIGKGQTQYSYPLTHSPPTAPRVKHIHISLTPSTPFFPGTTLIPSTSAALDAILEPRVPLRYSCHALIPTTTRSRPPLQHFHHFRTLTLSQHTHNQQYTHHSHRIHIGYQNNLTDRLRTTT